VDAEAMTVMTTFESLRLFELSRASNDSYYVRSR
jgi:hypothetical protein